MPHHWTQPKPDRLVFLTALAVHRGQKPGTQRSLHAQGYSEFDQMSPRNFNLFLLLLPPACSAGKDRRSRVPEDPPKRDIYEFGSLHPPASTSAYVLSPTTAALLSRQFGRKMECHYVSGTDWSLSVHSPPTDRRTSPIGP